MTTLTDCILKFLEHLGTTVLLDQGVGLTDSENGLKVLHKDDTAPVKQLKPIERTFTNTTFDDNGSTPYDIEDEFEALTNFDPMDNMLAKLKTASDLAQGVLDLRLEIMKLNKDLCKETAKLKAKKDRAEATIKSLREEVTQLKAAKESGKALMEAVKGG